jgi:O-glycosyl hydrolase
MIVPGRAPAAEPIQVRPDPQTCHQVIDGFGASDAWRCQFVGRNWPLEKRERIADLLFSQQADPAGNPRGIGLSIWRFYLSAGTAEQAAASGIANPWRRGECFLNADGTYDWSKQAGQRWFLQAARKRGVERFLAFSNAPPVHLSKNGKGYATSGNLHLNVKPGRLDDYADYLVDVMDHFSECGTGFEYLSPVNEPQWNWDGTGQEGTPALNEEICALVRYLSDRLSARRLTTKIVIGEAGTIGHAAMPMEKFGMVSDGRDDQARFFFDPQSPFYIGDLPNVERIISAHSYQSVWPLAKQVEYRRMLHQALRTVNPQLGYWQSEYCILQRNGEIGGGGGRDLGMDTALYVARIIHHDLTLANARSWQWWTALSQVDFKDGLVYLDDGSAGDTGRMGGHVESLQHDGEIRQSKLLWTLGNYSRFVRPGMVRIECHVAPRQSTADGVLVSAFRDDRQRVVVVLVNLSPDERNCQLELPGPVDVYTTSHSANLLHSRQAAPGVTVPGRAVVTVRAAIP